MVVLTKHLPVRMHGRDRPLGVALPGAGGSVREPLLGPERPVLVSAWTAGPDSQLPVGGLGGSSQAVALHCPVQYSPRGEDIPELALRSCFSSRQAPPYA